MSKQPEPSGLKRIQLIPMMEDKGRDHSDTPGGYNSVLNDSFNNSLNGPGMSNALAAVTG